jgi:hypothetical protein
VNLANLFLPMSIYENPAKIVKFTYNTLPFSDKKGGNDYIHFKDYFAAELPKETMMGLSIVFWEAY